MYTHPSTAEQCLHNALKVVNAMRYAGIDYDIQVGLKNWNTRIVHVTFKKFLEIWDATFMNVCNFFSNCFFATEKFIYFCISYL